MADWEANKAALDELEVTVIAVSVDSQEQAQEVKDKGLSFTVAYGATKEDGELIGAWWSEDRGGCIQPAEFLLGRGGVPCGLGARDTLRLEAGLLLHGSDMDSETNPIEAGLGRFVALDKGDFCGAGPVRAAAREGTERQLVAFEMTGRGALPRSHSPLLADGAVVGQVSSGGYAPTLDINIGLGYVPAGLASPQQRLQVDVRGNLLDAVVVTLPFYSRPRP